MREQREFEARDATRQEADAGEISGPGKLTGPESRFGKDGGLDGRPPILDDSLRNMIPTLD